MNKYQNFKIWTLLLAQLFYIAGGTVWAQEVEPQNRKDWRQWLEKARTAYKSGDFEKALECYKVASLGVPKEVDLAPELAQTYYRLKDQKEAKKWYDRANKDAAIAYNKGNVAYGDKEYDKAIAEYKKALKLNPDFEKAKFNLNKTLQLKNKQNPPPPPSGSNSNPNPQNKPLNNPQKSQEDKSDSKASGLTERSVERLLNQLMKQEAQTKRKVSSAKEDQETSKSTKDW